MKIQVKRNMKWVIDSFIAVRFSSKKLSPIGNIIRTALTHTIK
jgi:hypothetical protein